MAFAVRSDSPARSIKAQFREAAVSRSSSCPLPCGGRRLTFAACLGREVWFFLVGRTKDERFLLGSSGPGHGLSAFRRKRAPRRLGLLLLLLPTLHAPPRLQEDAAGLVCDGRTRRKGKTKKVVVVVVVVLTTEHESDQDDNSYPSTSRKVQM